MGIDTYPLEIRKINRTLPMAGGNVDLIEIDANGITVRIYGLWGIPRSGAPRTLEYQITDNTSPVIPVSKRSGIGFTGGGAGIIIWRDTRAPNSGNFNFDNQVPFLDILPGSKLILIGSNAGNDMMIGTGIQLVELTRFMISRGLLGINPSAVQVNPTGEVTVTKLKPDFSLQGGGPIG